MTAVADVALQEAAARLAVLPFEQLSAQPADPLFARGFVEDLIVELARFPTLEVLHPDTSLAPGEPQAIFDGAGVSHYLRGTVRRAGDAIRVTDLGRERPHGNVQPLRIDAGNRHRAAVRQNRLGNRAADAARTSRHDRSSHGSFASVPGSWFIVPGSRFMVPGSPGVPALQPITNSKLPVQ